MKIRYNSFVDMFSTVERSALADIMEVYDCINLSEFIDYIKHGLIDCLEYIPGTGEIIETIA